MPEPCPPRTSVRAFACGLLPEPEAESVHQHLSTCLECARALEAITREQLAGIGTDQLAPPTTTESPALAQLIETALGDFPGSRQSSEAAVRAALEPPRRTDAIGWFAGYDVLEVAGSGGMGVVLKAHDPTLHRVVALKILSPNRAWDEASVERFLREARTIASLQQDNVVAIYSAGREKGLPFLVMPFHEEGTLEQRLHHTPTLDADDVARIGLQLARALEITHAKGVLHRDIKPSNVLLEDGLKRVRLSDFGLAEPVRSDISSAPKAVAGTPQYMAPEQARGEAIDERSDLYGLGALLHHLATGQPPHRGGNAMEVLARAASGESILTRLSSPQVPRALASTIDRLLMARPSDRYASASELANALNGLVTGQARHSLRIQQGAMAALAAGLLAVAGIVLLDWTGRTAVINAMLCRRSGDTYFVRGRFGTFARLPDAVAASRPHDVIEARFSTEQVIDSFRIGGKPLTIRAARGFTPVLVATNNAQPMILVDAPVALEGLTLWRRGPRLNFALLISVEQAPLHLLNCRLLRSGYQGQNVLVSGQLRAQALDEATARQRYRAILGFQHGSSGSLKNCLIAGTRTTAIEIRASTNEPTSVVVENSLFLMDNVFTMAPEPETAILLAAQRTVFVTSALIDLDESFPVRGISCSWRDCLVDRSGGALLRVNQSHGGEVLLSLSWLETNVVYAGRGGYVHNRRRRGIDDVAEWNDYMQLTTNHHQLTERQAFPETCVRSGQTLQVSDLQLAPPASAAGVGKEFAPNEIGEGRPYADFKRTPEYKHWQKEVAESIDEWRQSQTARQ